MTRTSWRDVFARLRHTPPLLLAQKVVRRIPLRPVDVGKLCFLRLDGVPRVSAAMLRGPAAVRRATPADVDDLARLQNKRPAFQARFAEGDRCAVAVVDDRIVGYEWFCDKATHREAAWGYTIAIPGDCVYAYDAYIDPAYRNSGIWLRFKAYLGDWMVQTGKQTVLTFVELGNEASLRTHVRFGFRPSTTVLAVKLFGARLFADQSPSDSRSSPASGLPVGRRVSFGHVSGSRK